MRHRRSLVLGATAATIAVVALACGTFGGEPVEPLEEAAAFTGDGSGPLNVAELNTTSRDFPGWLSVDECRFDFSSDRAHGVETDIYMAERSP